MTLTQALRTTVLCTLPLCVAGPAFARFLSPDPEPADQDNFNRYSYASNNPCTFVDPDGRCARVTGSHVCSSTVAVAAMAKTAYVPKTFSASMVRHEGPERSEPVEAKEAGKVVGDANKAGQTAQVAGDSRAIVALNRIASIIIDGSDWSQSTSAGTRLPDARAVAHAQYGSGVLTLNAVRYFSRAMPYRVGIFIHEALHLDDEYQRQRLEQLNDGCAAWGCKFESDVEAHKNKIMKSYIPEGRQ